MLAPDRDRVVTQFVVDDFPFTDEERASLTAHDLSKIADWFGAGTHWDEVAEHVVATWRDWKEAIDVTRTTR